MLPTGHDGLEHMSRLHCGKGDDQDGQATEAAGSATGKKTASLSLPDAVDCYVHLPSLDTEDDTPQHSACANSSQQSQQQNSALHSVELLVEQHGYWQLQAAPLPASSSAALRPCLLRAQQARLAADLAARQLLEAQQELQRECDALRGR